MSRKKIVVLRGGPSSEFDISLKTGKSVIDNLKEDHDITDIIIDKQGCWFCDGIEKSPSEIARGKDLFFNAMHGEYGEDGKIQELLESLGVPFTGPQRFGAVISMNKPKTKDIYKNLGFKTPHSTVLVKNRPIDEIAFELFRTFPMPVIIKPIDKGSSLGISIARDFQSLVETLTSLFLQSEKLLVEEYIKGKEATVGVIDGFRGQKHYALLPVEIRIPKDKEFFDNTCKYNGSTDEICPGTFTTNESKEMQEIAKAVHEALGLRHYSRTDFIVHPRRGIFILETNSLPGLTNESLMPKGLEPIGSNYKEFLEHIVDIASI